MAKADSLASLLDIAVDLVHELTGSSHSARNLGFLFGRGAGLESLILSILTCK